MDRVSASNPCPICKKPDWCLIAPDRSVCICQRIESGKKCKDAGWLHKLIEDPPKTEIPYYVGPVPHYEGMLTFDWEESIKSNQ